MFNWVFNLLTSFILLGLVEAVVKPAATYWVRRKIVRWTPVVLSYVDQILPDFLLKSKYVDLDYLVRAKFSELTGDDWSSANLDYFWNTYDPRVTLAKLNSTAD